MPIYRVFPQLDTWITNRIIDKDVAVTATGSNYGRSPSLSIFSYEPEIQSGTLDLARALLKFSVAQLSGKIYDEEVIPSSSVSYYLKMFNMVHEDTVPTSYDLFVFPLSRSWDEGNGIDEDNDRDSGVANWIQPVSTADWVTTGSDFLTTEYGSASQHFDYGDEDLEVNITDMVVNWLTGTISNNGMVVKLGDTEEETDGYFRKAFHSRGSMFVDKIPYIEARWSNVVKDNRSNFAFGNSSKLYLYNFIRGELTNLTEPVIARVQDSLNSASYQSEVTASRIETGIYEADFTVSRASTYLSATWRDVWYSGSIAYMTSSFQPLVLTGSQVDPYDEFVIDVVNLKRVYDSREEARLIANVRKRDYVTHVGPLSSGSLVMEKEYIEKLYYSIINHETGETVVPFGTGSITYTQMSYNDDGSYFNIWMNSFVPGFVYEIIFLIDINRYDKKVIQDGFLFKVV